MLMPLIILSGYPCTGKTTFAELLASALRSSGHDGKVVIINEESLHMGKQQYYGGNTFLFLLYKFKLFLYWNLDAAREKLLRQNLKSAVDHALNASTYVILDSLNYIKGNQRTENILNCNGC